MPLGAGGFISSAKKSSGPDKGWRYPPPVGDIQVNHCKNPRCGNFGVPPHLERGHRRKSEVPAGPGDYVVVAAGKGQPVLRCELCQEHIPMQSNLAIVEELLRIARYLELEEELSCPNEECRCYGVPVSAPNANYKRFGKTAAGAARFQCLDCKKTFSKPAKPTHRQRITHKNRDVFTLLCNTMPLKRIAKVTGLTIDTVFRKIDFIHQQCIRFAGARELTLPTHFTATRYVAIDRQRLNVNWTSRDDRRNVQLWAVGSADMDTGYVFGMHLNFDPEMDTESVIKDMAIFKDSHLPAPFRRHARVWLPQDYLEAALRSHSHGRRTAATVEAKAQQDDILNARIEGTYAQAQLREDIEANDASSTSKLPDVGMEVHEQATLNAHLQFLAGLLRGAKKLRFFMDQEPGLRAAFMAALSGRVKERTADAWFVQVLKEATIDQKRRATKLSQERFANAALAHPWLSEAAVEVKLMREAMASFVEMGKWNDRWVRHPFSTMGEPDKRVTWLTDIDTPEEAGEKREDQLNHAARLYLKASLYPIDRFFMQVRRGLSMAERPLSSSSNRGRVWTAYAAYHPGNLAKILEIFRVYYNYCERGKDKQTPAMRLGLAKAVIDPQDILYFC